MALNDKDKEFIEDKFYSLSEDLEEVLKEARESIDNRNADKRTIQELEEKVASADFEKNALEAQQLREQRAQLTADMSAFAKNKRDEYNKGYVDAYAEIANKMKTGQVHNP